VVGFFIFSRAKISLRKFPHCDEGEEGGFSRGWMFTVYGTVRVVQKKLEASFSQNELKDMPGQNLYMHTGLNFFFLIHTHNDFWVSFLLYFV
jgi:hypothetical protein